MSNQSGGCRCILWWSQLDLSTVFGSSAVARSIRQWEHLEASAEIHKLQLNTVIRVVLSTEA